VVASIAVANLAFGARHATKRPRTHRAARLGERNRRPRLSRAFAGAGYRAKLSEASPDRFPETFVPGTTVTRRTDPLATGLESSNANASARVIATPIKWPEPF
jgi:hypothetical protein